MKLGSVDISDLKLGSTQINEVRYGAALVWQKSTGSTYDADFQAKIDYANANAIPVPATTELDRLNQRVIDYKATGGWDRDDVVLDLSGTADPAFKLICIKRRIQCVSYGSMTWSIDGATGNGTNTYIDPLFNVSQGTYYTRENAGFMAYKRLAAGDVGTIAGLYTGSASGYIFVHSYSDGMANNINSEFFKTSNLYYHGTGLKGAYRAAGVEYGIGSNGSESQRTRATTGLYNEKVFLMARYRRDLGVGNIDLPHNGTFDFLTIGASKRDLHAAIETAMT